MPDSKSVECMQSRRAGAIVFTQCKEVFKILSWLLETRCRNHLRYLQYYLNRRRQDELEEAATFAKIRPTVDDVKCKSEIKDLKSEDCIMKDSTDSILWNYAFDIG